MLLATYAQSDVRSQETYLFLCVVLVHRYLWQLSGAIVATARVDGHFSVINGRPYFGQVRVMVCSESRETASFTRVNRTRGLNNFSVTSMLSVM